MKTILLISAIISVAWLQQKPTGDHILRNVEQQLTAIDDYTVELRAEVHMERLRIPAMKATMYFKKPDNVHFEAPGFAMLPREGFTLSPTVLRERFDATVLGKDTIDGQAMQKLQLDAKDQKTRLRQLVLWVDTGRWVITKFEAIPYQGRSLSVTFHYALQQGRFWLPDTMNAAFGFPAQASDSVGLMSPYAPQISEVQRPPPRSGSVKVSYSNYRINTGLSDEIFQRKEGEK